MTQERHLVGIDQNRAQRPSDCVRKIVVVMDEQPVDFLVLEERVGRIDVADHKAHFVFVCT